MKLLDEFKAFALKGSVVDLAVGVIIGGAFGKIVSSLTSDIIMPPIGWLIGGVDFSDLRVALPRQPLAETADIVYINYGSFIQTTLDFLIIALVIFFAVKFMNTLRRTNAQSSATPPPSAPSPEQTLLTEIRDILKEK